MLNYNAPEDGQKSTIDSANSDQMNTFFYLKKALIEARKKAVFGQMASTINMPKHMGKKIKRYVYVPLLDDLNVNSQGIDASGAVSVNGNLYGSSKDVGTITGRLPLVGENGGRVNRVGFTRLEREGTMYRLGFFYEFSKDSLDFDSDAELKSHLARESVNGAYEIYEDLLQLDLLGGAGVVLYAGAAEDDDEVTAEVVGGVPASIVTYDDLRRMEQILDENRTPKQTKMITGTRLIDTKTVSGGRFAYIGIELQTTIEAMVDQFERPAFIPAHQYAAGTTLAQGEVGACGGFRFIVNQEMMHWAGAGAEVDSNPGYRSTPVSGTDRYDVFPILVVGDDSFNTIGFETSGDSAKFNIITKMPGREMATPSDPYGLTGFSSTQFWYGFLLNRPERIGIIKTVAKI